MKNITIVETKSGFIHDVSFAPDQIPGRYKNKDVIKITDVPMAVSEDHIMKMYRETIFGTTRRVIPYSEFKHCRLIIK